MAKKTKKLTTNTCYDNEDNDDKEHNDAGDDEENQEGDEEEFHEEEQDEEEEDGENDLDDEATGLARVDKNVSKILQLMERGQNATGQEEKLKAARKKHKATRKPFEILKCATDKCVRQLRRNEKKPREKDEEIRRLKMMLAASNFGTGCFFRSLTSNQLGIRCFCVSSTY